MATAIDWVPTVHSSTVPLPMVSVMPGLYGAPTAYRHTRLIRISRGRQRKNARSGTICPIGRPRVGLIVFRQAARTFAFSRSNSSLVITPRSRRSASFAS
jgi:hypothetical protein